MKYKVVKVYRDSDKREVLAEGLTREEAQAEVGKHPNSDEHMVVFTEE